MLKHPRRPKDVTQLAVQIAREALGESPKQAVAELVPGSFAARGRMGGLRGGKARAKALSKKRRSQIAKKAARTRWKKAR